MMFRPRESHDLRLIRTNLVITPEPAHLRWLHDPFDNSVAVATFEGTTTELRFESTVTLEHFETSLPEYPLEEYARTYPFRYSDEDFPNLVARPGSSLPGRERGQMGVAVSRFIGLYRHHEDAARHDPRHSRTVHLHAPR